jgi:YebC/PmpR family DNA-binding regulatory protein
MSGHSKWATTKRQKAVTDAKRSSIFTKLSNNISIAAKKGADPVMNFSLRIAIDKAKAANMPKDNIEKSIKRGTGELGGNAIEELYYEGFGPSQSQFIIKCITDNKNRSASTVRHIFTKFGGSLGSVAWNFEKKGIIRIANGNWELGIGNLGLDEFELELIDNGAQDIQREDEGMVIYTDMENLQKVKDYLENKKIQVESAEVEFVDKEQKDITNAGDKETLEKFIDELDENEDVSEYYSNT